MTLLPSGLDVAEFARAFPFHLIVAPDLTIAGVGSGLTRLDPDIRIGSSLAEHFSLDEGGAELSWARLCATPEAEVCLVHRRLAAKLRGRMAIAGERGPLVFLGAQPPDAIAAGVAPLQPVDRQASAGQSQRLAQCLRLHHRVAHCLTASHDADDVLSRLPEAMADGLGWPGAVLWRKGPGGDAVVVRSFRLDDEAAASTAELARQAFRTGAPAWSADGCAGRGGLAIPANTDAGTIAAITCLSHAAETDGELASELYLTAGQLAHFLIGQQQRARLKRLTGELSAIFELSDDGFVAFNGDGVLSYLNPAFARMTGFERDDLRGIDEAEFERRLATLLEAKQAVRTSERGDETIHLAKPRATVLHRLRRDARDADGKLFERLFYFRDITLETELLRANGEFFANVAHELRTPMASIHGFVELLLKCELPADKQREVLQTVNRQSTRLIDLVSDLLEIARFEARAARDLDRQPQPLAPVIRATIADLLVRDDPRVVDAVLPDDDASPWASIDRDRLVQALTNVLSNAYKYSPDGGPITLRLCEEKRSEQQWVGIAVRDRGIGLSREQCERLFDRFFRANPSGPIPGTGLGMAMVKKIIDAHGGRIGVDSALGVGTEITLWLPRCAPGAPA